MRLLVEIEIGGDLLSYEEHGRVELARVLHSVTCTVVAGGLAQPGDELRLLDTNSDTAGYARMVPDWTAGDEVWVTAREGALLRSRIEQVGPSSGGYRSVRCRFTASNELLTPVVVDQDGRDQLGRPVLARAVET